MIEQRSLVCHDSHWFVTLARLGKVTASRVSDAMAKINLIMVLGAKDSKGLRFEYGSRQAAKGK